MTEHEITISSDAAAWRAVCVCGWHDRRRQRDRLEQARREHEAEATLVVRRIDSGGER